MGKRIFDIFFSISGLVFTLWLIVLLFLISSLVNRVNGFFFQERIGQYGKKFTIIKIRSIKLNGYITPFGKFIRNYKLDELPQLINVLTGSMSFVGPRPDIAGYYDNLKGADREVLRLKPGITGPASLKYFNEEALLQLADNPKKYNDEVLFPDKVHINLNYLYTRSLLGDIKIIINTLFRQKPMTPL